MLFRIVVLSVCASLGMVGCADSDPVGSIDLGRHDRGPAPDSLAVDRAMLPDRILVDRAWIPDRAAVDRPRIPDRFVKPRPDRWLPLPFDSGIRPDSLVRPTCATPCDCFQGLDCVGGICSKSPMGRVMCCTKPGCTPVGAACVMPSGAAGTCATPSTCTSLCDCLQGMDCVKNACVTGPVPKYCCSKPGCPMGVACTHASGIKDSCASSTSCSATCDCHQGLSCIKGVCTKNPSGVGYCCDRPNCPPGRPCVDRAGTPGTCSTASACKTHCDCLQGMDCVSGRCATATPPVYCCGNTSCPVGQACRYSTGSSSTCPSMGACVTDCDCYQSMACVLGSCTKSPSGPAYCCTRAGCPSGLSCRLPAGGVSTCP